MKHDATSRRMFLQGAGTAVLAIPFLPSLLPRSARAAAAPAPKYVHINSSWCLPRAQTYPLYLKPWPAYPQPAGTTPGSVPWIQKDADTKYQSLKAIVDFQGKLSFTLDEKWNPFVDRMNLVTNAHAYVADNKFNASVGSTASSSGGIAHGPGAAPTGVTGYPNGNGPALGYAYSVDWLVEQALSRSGAVPPLPALRIHPHATAGENVFLGFCWGTVNGTDTRIPMLKDMSELRAKLAGLKVAAPSDPKAPDPQVVARRARIDSVLADFNELVNHRRISSVDKQRLGHAVDMWRSVEDHLDHPPAACAFPNLDGAETNWRVIHQTCMDTAAIALACGVTRNVAYGLIHGGDDIQQIPGVGDSRVPGESSPSITDPYFATLRWRSDLVTRFLGRLDALRDENGHSLLNSCLAVWAHTNANGNHGMLGHSLVVVGGASGKLELGWHVDAGGAPVNRFHLTNMLAMGLGLGDIEKNGRAGFGEYSGSMAVAAGGFETSEKDAKTDSPTSREYDMSKRDHFFADAERRKPFPYLKTGA